MPQALQKAVKQMAAKAGTEALTHNIHNEGLKARPAGGVAAQRAQRVSPSASRRRILPSDAADRS